ncbi:MAG: hypothetical protein Q9218_006595 [Villophora microphyllina]
MDSDTKEVSPEPSKRGLKSVLSKARRGGKNNASTVSINGADTSSDSHGIRSSIDSGQDKLRASRGSSLDDGASVNASSNISKLIPSRIQKKRQERKAAKQAAKEEAEAQEAQEDDGRGRSISEQAATAAVPLTRSRSTLAEEGSLMTNDSDGESPLSPPPLISHQSHIGYLTSSSPLIKTTTAVDVPEPSKENSPAFHNPQYHKAATFSNPPEELSLPSSLAPKHAATMGYTPPGISLDAKEAESTSDGRGVSPSSRIKDVFRSKSKKNAESPPHSPDRASVASIGSGNTLGSMLGAERRNDKSRKDSQATTNLSQPAPNDTERPSTGTKELPPISTIPKTPTSAGLETPLTTVTPPTPTDQRSNSPTKSLVMKQASAGTNSNTITSPSGNMISHRRIRSDTGGLPPSKLSNAVSAPLTPTIEESRVSGTRTPGTQGSPGSSGGFFSSMFTAAQSAANTLTNTIANNPSRPKSAPIPVEEGDEDTERSSVLVDGGNGAPPDEKKPLAIDTIGSGDLSLDHLGITSDRPETSKSSTFPLLTNGSAGRGVDGHQLQRDEATARVEDAQAARAVSAAYSEKAIEPTSTPVAEDIANAKPRSLYEHSITGDQTPPNGSIFEGNQITRRSGSVRSRVGAVARRHRNSSAATGNTIGTAIASSHAGLANASVNGSTPKLTGFAVANKKRNKDFHQTFRSVPEDDYLIEDYSCALQKEILLAGRLYVSEGHICFSSNILGWVTMLVISFDEIVSVEKESTAMVFPNAIAIQTLQARHTFRSLLSREATYELLIGIWKLSHPNLKSSLNGARLDAGGTGDKTEKVEPSVSDDGSDGSEEEEVYDEDEDDDDGTGSMINAAPAAPAVDDQADPSGKPVTRKASNLGAAIGSAAGGVPTQSDGKAGDKAAAASAATADFPGPTTHGPTECGDADTHYDKVLKDEVIPAPLGKIYSMMFGPASGGFIGKWMLDQLKVTELQMEDDKKGLSEEKPTRFYSYIKPLYAAIGPKSTKCLSTENLDFLDLEKAVSVTITTQTPDVPSGNVFSVKTRYCLMWASGNSTRLLINCTVEWTGKSWLKGPIEKGANDGQQTYADDLVKALKAGVTLRARAGTGGSKLKKGRRRKGEGDAEGEPSATRKPTAISPPKQDQSWGVFEPVHGVLGPVADIVGPLISSNAIIAFLMFLLLISWFRGPKSRHAGNQVGYVGMPSPMRMAAYEEIWQTEESELWKWLEDRMDMQDVSYPASTKQKPPPKLQSQRGRHQQSQGYKAKLAEEAMSEREVNYAIQVTEEKLEALKEAVQQKKLAQAAAAGDSPERRQETIGPSTPPLLDQTIGDHFASIVSKFGDRTAVISRHQQTRLTYRELDRKSNALARGLRKLGVKKGDRVAISLGNNVDGKATYAVFKLGAILVPLNPAFNAHQVIAALNHLKSSHLIVGAETNLPRKPPRSNVPLLQQIVLDLHGQKVQSEAVPSLSQIIIADNSSGRIDTAKLRPLVNYNHVWERDTPGVLEVGQSLCPNDVVNIQFTSGTTSAPKAACLTHRSILNNGKSIGDRMLLTEYDIVCCPPPLFHCFGCILGYMATATHGSAVVFPTEAFDPLATLRSVQEERCTALYGVPTMFIAELDLLQNGTVPFRGFEHLRTGIAAGSSIPAELMRKLHKRLNLTELTICYGMTETSPVSAMTTTDDPLDKRIDSVGRLLPHVEAKIVDPMDRRRVLPVNSRGELAVSGYLVMKEYWDDPLRTAEVMLGDDSGKTWMHTGDEAEMDADGYVKITGRIKDIIIKGGENIHPLEVENCLLGHPGVSEVSVVGLPDDRYGETVAAFIVRTPGEELSLDEVRLWVGEKLSHHLVPKHIFWVNDYPKTASGKIQKFKLREDGIQLLKE